MSGLLWVGDIVAVDEDKAGTVVSIMKCQSDGHCIYGLDGVNFSMLTDKIVVNVNINGKTREVKGSRLTRMTA